MSKKEAIKKALEDTSYVNSKAACFVMPGTKVKVGIRMHIKG